MEMNAAPVSHAQDRNVDIRKLEVARSKVCLIQESVTSTIDWLFSSTLSKFLGRQDAFDAVWAPASLGPITKAILIRADLSLVPPLWISLLQRHDTWARELTDEFVRQDSTVSDPVSVVVTHACFCISHASEPPC